jgi:glutathione S-transferase
VRPLYHLAEPEHWDDARRSGHYERSTRGASLADVGYVHCSFVHQVDAVASAVYDDWEGDLLLLRIDASRLAAEVREEDLDGLGQTFPHVYGPVPVSAVDQVRRMVRVHGSWRLQ